MNSQSHWLFRFSAAQWLAAADNELAAAKASLPRRRSALTHARRACGMGLNGVLARHLLAQSAATPGHPDTDGPEPEPEPEQTDPAAVWGRSYIDHLRRIAGEAPLLGLPQEARAASQILLKTPVMLNQGHQKLVRLRAPGDDDLAEALACAGALLAMCASLVSSP